LYFGIISLAFAHSDPLSCHPLTEYTEGNVNQKDFLDALDKFFPAFVEDQLRAYRDFDATHTDPAIRISIEPARPKWVNARTIHLLEMRFGRKGNPKVVVRQKLRYLFVDCGEYNVGIRAKKLGPDWKSYNHKSGQQDDLRLSGRFAWHKRTYHLILGYRDLAGLEPALTHVALTWEHDRRVDVISQLWTATDGIKPMREVQENLPLPPPPKMRPRRKRSDERGDKTG
jgi:hypothetical protein